jgi:hypothetical protein
LGIHDAGWCLPDEWLAGVHQPVGVAGDVCMNVIGTDGVLNLILPR